jgi:periplasmic divalent cation tolerance protein
MLQANEEIVVLTTIGNRAQADAFARELVHKRLAACVSALGEATSYYRWESEAVAVEQEIPLLIKTRREKLPQLKEYFDQAHPYELPEFIVLSIEQLSEAYAAWMKRELQI